MIGAPVTDRIARFVTEIDLERIPARDLATARLAFADCVGVTLAAVTNPAGRTIVDYVRELGGTPEAGVIGAGFKTSRPLAALANGTLAHALDWDDVGDVGHSGAAILPVVISVGHALDCSGRECLLAYVAGFETMHALVRGFDLHGDEQVHGLHMTPVFGVMGATAAAARLYGLDEPQTRRALGIAASSAAGVLANLGYQVKPLHVGNACKNAVVAVDLARRGLDATPDVFDHEVGFGRAVLAAGESGRWHPDRVVAALGDRFHVADTLSFKKYPCCYYTHRALDSLLGLMREHELTEEAIESVEMEIRNIPPFFHPTPETGSQGRFSLEYCLAAALTDRDVGVSSFADDKVQSAAMRRALGKVRVVRRPIWAFWRQGSNRVSVRLSDGRLLQRDTAAPLGDVRNPMPAERVHDKFLANARDVLGDGEARRMLERLLALESVGTAGEIMEPLTACAART